MTIGVYQFENIITKYKYIGSSFNIENRYKQHIRKLRINKHYNKYFQHSYNIHGIDSFVFKIIFVCHNDISDSELRLKEQSYIDQHNLKNLYNQCPVAGSTKNKNHSEETKLKISKSSSGRKMSFESREKIRIANLGKKATIEQRRKQSQMRKNKPIFSTRKKVIQIDVLTGKKINVFESGKIASLKTGVDAASISRVCNNRSPQAGGFKWTFLVNNE